MTRSVFPLVCAAVLAAAGCNRLAPGPAAPVGGASQTEFFTFCSSDVLSLGFPREYLVGGPGGSSSKVNLNSLTGGTVRFETYGTRTSTPAEAEDMMRKLYAELRRAAESRGCTVDGPTHLSDAEAAAGFAFKYAKDNNTGEVTVTRADRTEENKDKDGKVVYTVKVVVAEAVGKPPG
jgi:hypothetical protein